MSTEAVAFERISTNYSWVEHFRQLNQRQILLDRVRKVVGGALIGLSPLECFGGLVFFATSKNIIGSLGFFGGMVGTPVTGMVGYALFCRSRPRPDLTDSVNAQKLLNRMALIDLERFVHIQQELSSDQLKAHELLEARLINPDTAAELNKIMEAYDNFEESLPKRPGDPKVDLTPLFELKERFTQLWRDAVIDESPLKDVVVEIEL